MGLPEQRSAVPSAAFVGLRDFSWTKGREPAHCPLRRRSPLADAELHPGLLPLFLPGGIAACWLLIDDREHRQGQCR